MEVTFIAIEYSIFIFFARKFVQMKAEVSENILYPRKFFDMMLLNASNLALKLRSFPIFFKKVEILRNFVKFDDSMEVTFRAVEHSIFIFFGTKVGANES